MRSPFPGMDPYIEASGLWSGFHQRLIGALDDALAENLPVGYVSELQQRCYVVLTESDGESRRVHIPDVNVTGPRPVSKKARRPKAAFDDGSVAIMPCVEEEHREAFIEVQDAADGHVVACIEVLSPTNKAKGGKGWEEYTRKRRDCLRSDAHFLEIDLLLGGMRMPMAEEWPDSPYYVLLSRQPVAPPCRVWPASYRTPLPSLRVPLARGEPDVVVPLQPLVDAICRKHGYPARLDYSRPLGLPSPAADADWLRETAASAKR